MVTAIDCPVDVIFVNGLGGGGGLGMGGGGATSEGEHDTRFSFSHGP